MAADAGLRRRDQLAGFEKRCGLLLSRRALRFIDEPLKASAGFRLIAEPLPAFRQAEQQLAAPVARQLGEVTTLKLQNFLVISDGEFEQPARFRFWFGKARSDQQGRAAWNPHADIF